MSTFAIAERCGDEEKLSIFFIPYYVIDKIKALNMNYQELFDNNAIEELRKLIGTVESLQTDLITSIMIEPSILTTQNTIWSRISNQKFDLETKNTMFKDIIFKCSDSNPDNPKYLIEKSKNSVFIILNRNFLYNYELCGFEELYRTVSGDVCKALFTFFNEKLIYASAFFKAQYN